jgi:hypothetical protein
MQAKDIFSVVVAVLMVGSIVGFTAFYTFPDQENLSNGNSPIAQEPVAIDFIADDVNATVHQLLPTIKLQAETRETDVIALANEIYAIDGIKKVNGSFRQWSNTSLGTGFIYVADISFDADLNSGHIIGLLQGETTLESIFGFNYALVELPETIQMRSVDETFNLSRQYTFSENISEALLELGTIEGDAVNVSVTATFVGEDATNLMAFEQLNFTAEPVLKTTQVEADVASLESTLLFEASVPFSQSQAASTLEQDINDIAGIESAKVFFSSPSATLSISGESSLDEATAAELELFLNDLNAESVSLEANPLDAFVSFGREIQIPLFLEKKQAILSKLSELGISSPIEESESFLSGVAELEFPDSKQSGQALQDMLTSNFSEPRVEQPGMLALQEIPDSEMGKAHSVPSGEMQAGLKLGHSPGEKVLVEVNYALVRGLIQSVSAEEKQ